MYALRERRQHVTQEDFEFAVAKVSLWVVFYYQWVLTTLSWSRLQVLRKNQEGNTSVNKLFS